MYVVYQIIYRTVVIVFALHQHSLKIFFMSSWEFYVFMLISFDMHVFLHYIYMFLLVKSPFLNSLVYAKMLTNAQFPQTIF